ncbi:MOSC domain-containing protein [bacterium]|nr:MOSC domain-containing protein [bacterium]MBU3955566.1 MOSC domain-containing protein [bacterium]MBU4133794.1 MOSC domain-containing protein [bacterium]
MKIAGINISGKKGTVKTPLVEGKLIADFGFCGDAHAAADSAKQVSVLSVSSIKKMKDKLGDKITFGVFGENLDLEGIENPELPIGKRIVFSSGAELEVAEIGKKCHSGCEIFKICGKCIMPQEGIFCRVVKSGKVKKGDGFNVL